MQGKTNEHSNSRKHMITIILSMRGIYEINTKMK